VSGFTDADALLAEFQGLGGQPGLAYGIVFDGELVHAAGLGERWLGGPPPDAGTVFRIASMTKSFTAAAIVLLRDEGALALDDPAERYVSELRGWPPVTPDAARVSIRHLLTMTAGFPTDDPWGDRQQGLPLEEFARFLADGVSFAWVPGTRFEYSNLGYAILGRVITAVSGLPYPEFVTSRLLRPLGMTRTGFDAVGFADAQTARGYRRTPDGWTELPFDPCGAFAPMGGIFTCVGDLARWVAGFAAAFPPGIADDGTHPLRRASRREMQLPQVPTGWDRQASFPHDGSGSAYGFGLAVGEDPVLGRVVGHGGGYPGFGSYMRWHPASGTGVIALGNSTYARLQPLTARLLSVVLRQRKQSAAGGYAVSLAPGQQVWPQTLAARDAVNGLLKHWDDDLANRLFEPCVALDIPFDERKRQIDLIRERIGAFTDEPRTDEPRADEPGVGESGAGESASPAHCRWWLTGERGTVQAQILLTPHRQPRVQSLTLAVPPAAGSPLQRVLDEVVAWLNGTGPAPATAGLDVALLDRRLRAAAAWAGPCSLGACTAGDGTATVTVEVTGPHAALELTVAIDPDTGQLAYADITSRAP
jgi:CubicO group peptidase (beta-lactamase class C family)